ncbi:MAG TPA: YwiC-like family protein [Vicinamibacteria bacterium]|nr:YwiC-like family protein [Vicinamibacteria bacterium]
MRWGPSCSRRDARTARAQAPRHALAPTLAGLGIALAALGAFLLRHPLKLALFDWRRGTRSPRTRVALSVAAAYAILAFLGLALAVPSAPAVTWLPVALAAPLALVQLWYDVRRQGRSLAPELAASVALGASAPALMLAGGWSAAAGLASARTPVPARVVGLAELGYGIVTTALLAIGYATGA